MEIIKDIEVKKRVRKAREEKEEYMLCKDRLRFFIDLSDNKVEIDLINKLLEKCNSKEFGRLISFKDLCLFALIKINEKDIEKIQEQSLSEMDKVQMTLDEYNKKNGSSLSLGEYLVKQLKL